MQQLDTSLGAQSAEDEARMLADAVKAAAVIDWFADNTEDANRLKAMIFGGRL